MNRWPAAELLQRIDDLKREATVLPPGLEKELVQQRFQDALDTWQQEREDICHGFLYMLRLAMELRSYEVFTVLNSVELSSTVDSILMGRIREQQKEIEGLKFRLRDLDRLKVRLDRLEKGNGK